MLLQSQNAVLVVKKLPQNFYQCVYVVVVKVYMTDKRNMRSCIGNSSPWEKVFIATPMYVDMHNL